MFETNLYRKLKHVSFSVTFFENRAPF